MAHHHHHDHHHHASAATTDWSDMVEILDLDAEVLRPILSETVDWLHGLTTGAPVRRMLDLGSGTGTGAFALLRRFEQAEVIALDTSAGLLGRIEATARDLGVAERVRTIEADLDVTWPAVGTLDLVWASASLHHLADPVGVLTEIRGALRPGGLLAAMEMDSFPHFLPDDLGIGRPGLEARCQAAAAEARAAELPHFGADWGSLLRQAGFTVEAERPLVVDLVPPVPDSGRRYARASLRRMRSQLADRLDADDLAVLDTLAESDGPDGVLRREDLTVHVTRTVWVGRREAGEGTTAP